MTETVAVDNNPELNRYEIRVGEQMAGFAEYIPTDGLLSFTHTEIDPAFEGQGLGSRLVRAALDDIRDTGGVKVLAVCPFVKGWMLKHPEYADLLYGS